MRSNVLNRARQSGSWATDRVNDYLNKAQGVLYRLPKDWKELEQIDTASGVVGQENYNLPDDFERATNISLTDSNSNQYQVNFVDYDAVQVELMRNTGNARPELAAIYYQQLYFSRKLDSTYTINLHYIQRPADMSADVDTTPFPEFLLEEYAYAFLMRDLGHDKKFREGYQHFVSLTKDYVDSDGRNPDQLTGYLDGMDGSFTYWDEGTMW
jgi:hypothetical protein